MLDCGFSDPFFDDHRLLHEKLMRLQVPHEYVVRPGGHDWTYWIHALPYHLQFASDRLKPAGLPQPAPSSGFEAVIIDRDDNVIVTGLVQPFRGLTEIVNLGDMASGPLDARKTMDMLMPLDAVHVRGNHDRWLVAGTMRDLPDATPPADAAEDWCHPNSVTVDLANDVLYLSCRYQGVIKAKRSGDQAVLWVLGGQADG